MKDEFGLWEEMESRESEFWYCGWLECYFNELIFSFFVGVLGNGGFGGVVVNVDFG